jgi:hypothetical protein
VNLGLYRLSNSTQIYEYLQDPENGIEIDNENLISKHLHKVSIDAEKDPVKISPNNAIFLASSVQPTVSFFLAGVIYGGNKYKRMFISLCTLVFETTMPFVRELGSILDRSKIFTHTPTRDQLDVKPFGNIIIRSQNGKLL